VNKVDCVSKDRWPVLPSHWHPMSGLAMLVCTHNSSMQSSPLNPLPSLTLLVHSSKWCFAGAHCFEFSHSAEAQDVKGNRRGMSAGCSG
jgi:hypothetical protein